MAKVATKKTTKQTTAKKPTKRKSAAQKAEESIKRRETQAKAKIAALGPKATPADDGAKNLDFKPAAVGKESLKAFKQWLRADGPGKVKFARRKDPNDPDRTLPPGPQEYAAQVKRLYAQGLSLRAIEVLKVFKSASSKIKPESLAKIKAAAAAQAKAIGLN